MFDEGYARESCGCGGRRGCAERPRLLARGTLRRAHRPGVWALDGATEKLRPADSGQH